MPRTERLEYEDAYYHVMGRGRDGGRINIFHSDEFFEAFLNTLKESVERFHIVVHAYCLMSNHYHLIIQTPQANLSRAMRHVNGVYTQRHNRLAGSDGPIFRGRFKSILIDSDAYLLQLSRYIHRNPIETKEPMVEALVNYPWSSYPAYVNQVKCPNWLERGQVYRMLDSKQRYAGYAKYVARGNSEELTRFYNRGNTATVIGDKPFVEWLKEEKIPEVSSKDWAKQTLPHSLTIEQIVLNTASFYKLPLASLKELKKGRNSQLKERKVAIYVCQYLGDHRLKEIGDYFGLGHVGSVSHITSLIRHEIKEDVKLFNEIEALCLYIINEAT